MTDELGFEVVSTQEHADGSATMICNMGEKTKTYLINYALLSILKNGLKETVALVNSPTGDEMEKEELYQSQLAALYTDPNS